MVRRITRRLAVLSDYNPALFLFAFSCWAAFYGVALLLPGSYFEEAGPNFQVLRALGVPEALAGWAMIVDGFALFVTLLGVVSAAWRSFIGIITGVLWAFWGALILLGGVQAGLFAPGGAWSAFAGVLVMLTALHEPV